MRKLLLFVTLLFIGSQAEAQHSYYPVPRGPKCLEVGYSYPIGTAQFSYKARKFDPNTGILTDTSFTDRITSSGGFGAFGGYYFPIMRMGEKSRIALSVSYYFNALAWEGGFFNYSLLSDTLTDPNYSVSGTIEYGLPIGVDYKWGSDAIFSKSERVCYSFGAGVYPSMDLTLYRNSGGFNFFARPYLRAEAGFFAGICIKLRATYVMGKSDYISSSYNQPGNMEETKLSSTGTTVLSLVLMPMSWKFTKGNW